jgi:hypothetical protein
MKPLNDAIDNSQTVELSQVPINQWRDKENVISLYIYMYIYTMECYSAIKKNDVMSSAEKWMELETIMPS